MRRGLPVLNAFRHHRNSHDWCYRRTSSRDLSAQRLSASSEFAPRHASHLLVPPRRAQRLSASSEFALAFSLQYAAWVAGAQRLSASSEFARLVLPPYKKARTMCSTPFGIIGIRTIEDRNTSDSLFRCSTPFGIIGIRTPWPAPGCEARLGRQLRPATAWQQPRLP